MYEMSEGRHDTHQNDIQHNQTQRKGIICGIRHNDIQQIDAQYNHTLPLC